MTLPHEENPAGSSPHSGPMEVEIKLKLANLAETLARIRKTGFLEKEARSFERNVVFDDADRSLMKAKQLIRVREYRGETVLTYKGSPVPGRHKQREEIETTLGGADAFSTILNRLGFHATFRYEKYRTVLAREGTHCVVTVDETPIGPYLELEGEPDAIDEVAAELGFSPDDYITASYATLSQEYFAEHGIAPGDFVFSRMEGQGQAGA